jgi:hypothetical protein
LASKKLDKFQQQRNKTHRKKAFDFFCTFISQYWLIELETNWLLMLIKLLGELTGYCKQLINMQTN